MSSIRRYIDLINKQVTNESLAEDTAVSPADNAKIASLSRYIEDYPGMAKNDDKANWKLAHITDELKALAKKYRFEAIADTLNDLVAKGTAMGKNDPKRNSWYMR